MAGDFSFSLGGAEELSKFLKDFPIRLQRTVIDSAVSAGASFIKKKAQRNIMANGSYKTGNLYRSLKTLKVRKTHGIYKIFTQGPFAPKGQRAPHAHLVEFGTGPRKLKEPNVVRLANGQVVTITHTGSMPAKPFFRPAIDENHRELLTIMAQRMAKRMSSEATKMASRYGTLKKSFKKKLIK